MSFPSVRRSLSVAVPALAAALAVSCGGSDGSNVNGGDGNGGPNGNGTGGSIMLGTGANGNLPGTGGSGVTTITRDAACADGSGIGGHQVADRDIIARIDHWHGPLSSGRATAISKV